MLLNATNARIVLLTGTPIINYPNEIGILYNILRGHIKTWVFNIKTTAKLDLDIIKKEKANGLGDEIYLKAKKEFLNRYEKIDFYKYYLDTPFKESCMALYNWAPIADELKILDKEIVLNSIKLKWNLVENEFKELTKDLKFN